MQPLWLGDAAAAARVLRERPEASWPWVLARMLAEARRAAAHLRAHGRAHPLYGDGSLMAAALRRRPGAAPGLEDDRFRRAMLLVLSAL